MSIAYTIMKEEKLVCVSWAGTVTKEQQVENTTNVLRDPELPAAPRVIVDTTGAVWDPAVGEKDIQELVEMYREYPDKAPGAKVAVIAHEAFQRARIYERKAKAQGVNVIVFNEIASACIWLGVDKKGVLEWVRAKRAERISSTV